MVKGKKGRTKRHLGILTSLSAGRRPRGPTRNRERREEERNHAIAIAFDDSRPRNRFLNVSGYLFGIILNARRVQEIACKLFCTPHLSDRPVFVCLFYLTGGRVAIVLLMGFYFDR